MPRNQAKRNFLRHQLEQQVGESLITEQEFTELTGLSHSSIWRYVQDGFIHPIKDASGFHTFYRTSEMTIATQR